MKKWQSERPNDVTVALEPGDKLTVMRVDAKQFKVDLPSGFDLHTTVVWIKA